MTARNRITFWLMLAIVSLGLAVTACDGGGGDEDGDTSDGDLDRDTVETNETADADPDVSDGDQNVDGDQDADLDADESVIDGDAEEQPDGDSDRDADNVLDPGQLVLDPAELDFGLVDLYDSNTLDVTIKNDAETDAASLQVLSITFLPSDVSGYTVDTGCEPPFDLNPGESRTCEVTLAPDRPGVHNAKLRVVARTEADLSLEARTTLLGGTEIPISYVDPEPVEFGMVALGETAYAYVSMGNAGLADWVVEEISLDPTSDSAFSLLGAVEGSQTGLFSTNEGAVLEIAFEPTQTEQVMGWLLIRSNDPQVPDRKLPISGRASELCPNDQADTSCRESCLPFERSCTDDGLAMLLCNSEGDGWQDAVTCMDGQRCENGYCVWSICEAGSLLCHDGASVACADEGDAYAENGESCTDEDACTVAYCVPGVGCDYPPDTRICDDGNPCSEDLCDSVAGCQYEYENVNGQSCTDENLCTINERCFEGSCIGDELPCNDDEVCTIDRCLPELGCQFLPKDGGCNDGNICTKQDYCSQGACVPGETLACDDGNDCTEDRCDPQVGCVNTATEEACDDGDPCTSNDSCSRGYCRGDNVQPDDGVYCNGTEVCDSQSGDWSSINPISCNDGIACTVDSCNEDGEDCAHVADHEACDDDNPCTEDSCSLTEGCVHEFLDFNSPCDLIPGIDEVCQQGQCVYACTSDFDCVDAVACTIDYCDPATGHCRHDALHDFCSDGLWCNGEESCDVLLGCMPGTAPDCNDNAYCTQDRCDETLNACVHTPNHTACNDYNDCTVDLCTTAEGCIYEDRNGVCDDGNPCTIGDSCFDGYCKSGDNQLVCDDGNDCTDDSCSPGLGCVYQANARSCNDGDPCTDYDVCLDGECHGISKECDDGNYCNGTETCDGNGCQSGEPVSCDDFVTCTIDSCSPDSDSCVHEPDHSLCESDNPCRINPTCTAVGCTYDTLADGEVCREEEEGEDWICRSGICVSPCTQNEDCDDGFDCTQDLCPEAEASEETRYCTHTAQHAFCDDSLYCTGTDEFCSPFNPEADARGCVPGTPIVCDDGVDCTLDRCDENSQGCVVDLVDDACVNGNPCTSGTCTSTGCVFSSIEGSCEDANPCTVDDVCLDGQCVGQPKNCDDNNPCTIDLCDAGGCRSVQVANGTACGSDLVSRVCVDGQCTQGCQSWTDCEDDGIDCTVTYCDTVSHSCVTSAIDILCDDNLYCNGHETCDLNSGCVSGDAIECGEGASPCETLHCDEQSDSCVFHFDDDWCADDNPCTDNICTSNGCTVIYNTQRCNDGNACTVNDYCQSGTCTGEMRICDDGNACTADACDEELGCTYDEIGSECTLDEQCRVQICFPDQGCVEYSLDGVFCDDGDPCTDQDVCVSGACIGETDDCDDYNACTEDTCSDGVCTHMPLDNGTVCEQENFTDPQCYGGFCTTACESDAECYDGIDCTTDLCDENTGHCVYQRDDAGCDDGLFCNGVEICVPFAGCLSDEPVYCSDEIPCTIDICDEELDSCVHTAVDQRCDNGNPCTAGTCNLEQGCLQQPLDDVLCNDGLRCTTDDICVNGECLGSPISCDDGNPCTGPDDCTEATGCRNAPQGDGLQCGETGICSNGQCAETCTGDTDCDDGNDCTADVCDVTQGRCIHYPSDAMCDDGQYCNGIEHCHPSFGCMPGIDIVCNDKAACTLDRCNEATDSCEFTSRHELCDDGNPCTINTCVEVLGCQTTKNEVPDCQHRDVCSAGHVERDCGEDNECVNWYCYDRIGCVPVIHNGAACTIENNACVQSGVCIGMECMPDEQVDCNDGNPCTVDYCNPADGECFYDMVAENGEPCDDGSVCTVDDMCNGGQCQGQPLDPACFDDNECTEDGCDDDNGCVFTPLPDGTACSQGSCQLGVCRGSCTTDAECNDDLDCTEDICVDDVCVNTPQHQLCPQGNFCDGEAVCDPFIGCTISPEPSCNDGIACTVDSCDRDAEICTHESNNALCDDGNECVSDICDPNRGGCVYAPLNDLPCDDGNACTLDDYCKNGVCQSSGLLQCQDLNLCTEDSCDPEVGCVFEPLTGDICDDENKCTSNDTCQQGACVGEELLCETDDPCSYALCDPDFGCQFEPLTGPICDDGNPCTDVDVCIAGHCGGVSTLLCNDNNPCTDDFCSLATGCEAIPVSGRLCNDGEVCTVGDVCQLGFCQPGSARLSCDDGNPCTTDSCIDGSGCDNEELPELSYCDLDPDLSEACVGGECVEYCRRGSDCYDGIGCTEDVCDEQTHHCTWLPQDTLCNDGNDCNGAETCDASAGCLSGQAPDCEDGIDCTDDGCDPVTGNCIHEPQDWLCDDNDACTLDSCSPEMDCQHSEIEGCTR